MGEKVQLGRYAENPHQKGWSQKDGSYQGPTVLNDVLHGPAVGYNNLMDAEAALCIVLDMHQYMEGQPSVAVIKHKNPCGLATGRTLSEAFKNAWLGDEVSALGSIVGYSQPLDEKAAKLLRGKFVEVLVAPDYLAEALRWIQDPIHKKGNLRVIPTGQLQHPNFIESHGIHGGSLSQEEDNKLYLCDTVEGLFDDPTELTEPNSGKTYQVGTVTDTRFEEGMEGLVTFSIIAGKHTRSNAIVLVHEYQGGKYKVLGMGAGQPNRLDSAQKLALPKARENLMRQYFREQGLDYAMTMDKMIQDSKFRGLITRKANAYINNELSSGRVIAFSDAFFPKRDGLDAIAQMGVKYLICPSGSKADQEVIKAANEQDVALMATGIRHFKH